MSYIDLEKKNKHVKAGQAVIHAIMIVASLLVILVTAVWSLLDQYELNPTGMPDASDQYMVLGLWFLPVSVGLLGMVWFTRTRGRRSGREMAR